VSTDQKRQCNSAQDQCQRQDRAKNLRHEYPGRTGGSTSGFSCFSSSCQKTGPMPSSYCDGIRTEMFWQSA
jgi:hypothetical protein